ncbi:MAG TPA: acylphosphatase [Acidimicrobiia bacterium]|nr:acylphosphatase [Acidimicrobiia bacterium]
MSGRVQGVGFRWSCRRMAERQGVAGWCRNLPDGRVEACFEGADEAVERAVAWCRSGPPSALVTAVDITPETPQGEQRFTVG